MASPIDICNSALIKLGVRKISSFSEQTKAAQLCSEMYDRLRRKLLRHHVWNFAIARESLTEDTLNPPAFEFSHSHILPSDYLRILKVNPDSDPIWKIEGDRLVSDCETVDAKYIRDVTEVDKFDSIFKEALAYLIASELSYNLLQSPSQAELMYNKYLIEVKDTRSIDAQEGTPEDFGSDQWLVSRISGIDSITGRPIR